LNTEYGSRAFSRRMKVGLIGLFKMKFSTLSFECNVESFASANEI